MKLKNIFIIIFVILLTSNYDFYNKFTAIKNGCNHSKNSKSKLYGSAVSGI